MKTESIYSVFNPETKIPVAASRIHGITSAAVKGKPKFSDEAAEIRDFIGTNPIIAHNMKFDGAFLDEEFKRAGVRGLSPTNRLCTMMEAHRRASIIHGEDVKWPKLTEAGKYAGVQFEQSKVHDAMEDATNALKLAVGFMNTRLSPKGELENAFRHRTSDAQISPEQSNSKIVWYIVAALTVGAFAIAAFS